MYAIQERYLADGKRFMTRLTRKERKTRRKRFHVVVSMMGDTHTLPYFYRE
jgi:hypothetical protein